METLRIVGGLLVIANCGLLVVGFLRLFFTLPEGDVDNKLAGEKYRRIVDRRIR